MHYTNKTIGILGGGQLGRMTAIAAAEIGIKCVIYCPEPNCPASHVASKSFIKSYEDKKSLKEFAALVDVITYEFENIPIETIKFLQKLKPVLPDDRLLEIAQHRAKEKQFLNDIGIETAKWASIKNKQDVFNFLDKLGAKECILKTARFGYDGKGQTRVSKNTDLDDIFTHSKGLDLIAEELIDFACEVSVIIARDKIGQTACYTPCLNEHIDHILHKTTVPALLPKQLIEDIKKKAVLLTDAVDLIGVLAIEFFISKDGRLLANEIAPRPHNSGHWTIDACVTSQFEQHARTICHLPIGYPTRHSDAEMINIVGYDVEKIAKYIEMKNAHTHLYGKEEIREGRKMGHVTILKGREVIEK